MKYKAEQARLLSTADDVNYEVLKIYQMNYMPKSKHPDPSRRCR